jgi:hypothetical protein
MADGFYEEFMSSGEANPNIALDFSAADAMAEEAGSEGSETGQESDSPTDTDDGQTSESQTDTDTDAESKTSEEGSESESSTDKDGEKETKPLPFDDHPKWKEARAAEKRLTELLEKHGFDSAEALEDALSDEQSLKDLLGDRDAKKLVEDSQELKTIKDFWAEEKAKEIEQNETADDRAKRLKDENRRLQNKIDQDEANRKAIKDNEAALRNYEKSVVNLLDATEGLSADERGLAGLMLGVDNPMDDVDILDTKAVTKTAKQITEKLTKYISAVKQQAIDEYAKGKGELTPTPKVKDSTQSPVVKKKSLPKDASIDDVFADANQELLEVLKGMEWEM